MLACGLESGSHSAYSVAVQCLQKERVIIKRCFGQLKRRFPILQYVCRVKLEFVPKIIVARIALHNILKTIGDPDFKLTEDVIKKERNHDDNYDDILIRNKRQEVGRNLSVIINNFNI
ncbi:hypothetical protein RN001_009778 [Aquatica leii]|uniref:DDE Tnp4 domain-containing protein n=1 Tax=Aquatica leii TaxID=1421715 RepID=A0AAN7P5N7_9COLE|nr:hypothetical protein RN001_009778 [Aquatica leii]